MGSFFKTPEYLDYIKTKEYYENNPHQSTLRMYMDCMDKAVKLCKEKYQNTGYFQSGYNWIKDPQIKMH